VLVLQFVEFRIDRVVENVSLQKIDDFGRGVNANWLFQFGKQIVNIDWQTGDVIHVRMGYDHVSHGASLRFAQGDSDAAGIDRYPVVNHKASETLRGIGASAVIEGTG
jgi:hypothetical protein